MKIRKYFLLLLPFLSYSVQAQGDFDKLFVSLGQLCWENEITVINELIKGPLQKEAGDSLILLWERDCGKTEASIRTRILHDIKFKGKLDTIIPDSYWEQLYFKYLSGEEMLTYHLEAHLFWTQEEAERILSSKEWPAYEKMVLEILSCTSITKAYTYFHKKENYYNPEMEKLRQFASAEIKRQYFNAISIHYNYFYLTGDLADELGALHGFSFAAEMPFDRIRLSVQTGVAASEKKSYLRFYNENQSVISDLEYFIHLDCYLNYAFIEARRSRYSVIGGFGFAEFTTDLTYYNDADEEVAVGLSTFYPIFGLDYHREIAGLRSIGIRSVLKTGNFDSNEELRSPLDGFMIQNSLYFRF